MSKKDDILIATLDLINEEGIQSVTFAKILKRAGVGAGTVYNYFSDKEMLINEVYVYVANHMSEELKKNKGQNDTTVFQRFRYVLGNMADYALTYPKEITFLENFADSPYLSEETKKKYNHSMEDFLKIFEDGQNQGILHDMDPVICSQISMGIIIYGINGSLRGKYTINEYDKKKLIDAAWRAIKI